MSDTTKISQEFAAVEDRARDLGGSVAMLLTRTLEQSSSLVEHVLADGSRVAGDVRLLGVSVLEGLREELLSRGKDVRATRQQ